MIRPILDESLPSRDRAEAANILSKIEQLLKIYKSKTGVTIVMALESTPEKDDQVDDKRPRSKRV